MEGNAVICKCLCVHSAPIHSEHGTSAFCPLQMGKRIMNGLDIIWNETILTTDIKGCFTLKHNSNSNGLIQYT